MMQWLDFLLDCFPDALGATECGAAWSAVVLAGFVLALLILVLAGYSFFAVNREERRKRLSLVARDIAAIEDLAGQEARAGSQGPLRFIAQKYRNAFKRSAMAGWRIHGDR